MAQKGGGFIPMIRVVGFNGIVVTSWAVESRTRTGARSSVGRQCAVISARFAGIVNREIGPAAHGNARPCCTGRMTAARFKLEPGNWTDRLPFVLEPILFGIANGYLQLGG